MQRQWRSKPTKELIKIFENSVDLKLYLVQERGPLSFVFQDKERKKISVSIGDIVSCSCGGGRIEHCIHSIWVLNRMFKIQFNDPLILQLGFTDPELSKIIESRLKREKEGNTNTHLSKNKKNKNDPDDDSTTLNSPSGNRMDLYEDPTCPICQEDMYNIEGLFFCVDSCGHNFHLSCLKVWAEHKKATSDIISCPMCRAQWNEEEMKRMIIKNMAERSKNLIILPHKGINCKECSRMNIKAERFHCLNCKEVDLCVECFNLSKHDSSHYFLMKKKPEEKWLGIDNQSEGVLGSSSKLNGLETYHVKNIKLSQFLISILKDYDKKNTDGVNPIIEEDENNSSVINESNTQNNQGSNLNIHKCIVCNSDRSSALQLLKFKTLPNCKHLVHFKCADIIFKTYSREKFNDKEIYVDANFNKCKHDKTDIFPGLASLKFRLYQSENSGDNENLQLLQLNQQNMPNRANGNQLNLNLNINSVYNNPQKNKGQKIDNKNKKNITHREKIHKNNLDNLQPMNKFMDDFLVIKPMSNKLINQNQNPLLNVQHQMRAKSITPMGRMNPINAINGPLPRMGNIQNQNITVNLAMNIQRFEIEKPQEVQLLDIDHQNNENRNRLVQMRKFYTMRPIVNKKVEIPQKSVIKRKEDIQVVNHDHFEEGGINSLSNNLVETPWETKDAQIENMNLSNKGIKVVNLNMLGFKVKFIK
jgi:hypothetical protein